MEDKLAPCCSNLPKLTQKDLTVNVGDLNYNSPSLYEDIFDEKHFNELIDDPMLNSGQMTERTGRRGDADVVIDDDSTTEIDGTSTISTSNPIGGQQQQQLQPSQQPNVWNGNFYQFADGQQHQQQQFYPTTSQSIQPQIPTSIHQYPTTSTWQSQSTIDPPASHYLHPPPSSSSSLAPTRSLTSSNIVASNGVQPVGINRPPRPTLVRVKEEPRESIDQDREDFDYSPESHDAASAGGGGVSRGAVYAREYRRKTKSRITKLDHDNERLARENASLKTAYREAKTRADSLGREVVYLRQVIANDGAISTLLNAVVSNTSGLKFQIPLLSNDHRSATTSSQQPPTIGSKRMMGDGGKPNGGFNNKQRKMDENEVRKVKESIQISGDTPGICMHVNGDMVSIEFCPRCNRDARRGYTDVQSSEGGGIGDGGGGGRKVDGNGEQTDPFGG